jgi:hypothetical protein
MIDPEVNNGWYEIVKAASKSATSTQDLFHNTWLAHYLQSQFIVFANWNICEYKHEFKQIYMQEIYFIKFKPTKSHNQHHINKCNH